MSITYFKMSMPGRCPSFSIISRGRHRRWKCERHLRAELFNSCGRIATTADGESALQFSDSLADGNRAAGKIFCSKHHRTIPENHLGFADFLWNKAAVLGPMSMPSISPGILASSVTIFASSLQRRQWRLNQGAEECGRLLLQSTLAYSS